MDYLVLARFDNELTRANFPNLGDLAQCFCIRKYLKKYFPEYEVTEVFTRNYLDNSFGIRDYLKTIIKPNDIIFFQSGYCTQDLGGREDLMHQSVMQDFPDWMIWQRSFSSTSSICPKSSKRLTERRSTTI